MTQISIKIRDVPTQRWEQGISLKGLFGLFSLESCVYICVCIGDENVDIWKGCRDWEDDTSIACCIFNLWNSR